MNDTTGKKIILEGIKTIAFDSREVSQNSLFIAITGEIVDGHNYIQTAIEKGAKTIVCEKLPETLLPQINYHKVEDSQYALAAIASEFYQNPSQKLTLIGVTGTNGKTTIATLLFDLFTTIGYQCGLLSTIENRIGPKKIPSTHTTPNPLITNKLLSEMVNSQCQFCFMEVSSHGVVQRRIDALNFCGGIFTNLTHDHLDYHGTFKEYLYAKKKFFDNLPQKAFALTNADDKNGEIMLQNTKATKYTYSLNKIADFNTKIIEKHIDGTLLRINQTDVYTKLLGRFNAYNLTALFATTTILTGEEKQQEILTALSTLENVNGRFSTIRRSDGCLAIIDYSHTPDALKNALETIKEIIPTHTQTKIITVVGCGGNRDRNKRPLMAQIAATLSNQLIITSDNPRGEKAEDIINEMLVGFPCELNAKTLVIENRAAAIKTAITLAQKNDIILIAGKGHETYQEINGTKIPFSDTTEVTKCFNLNEK